MVLPQQVRRVVWTGAIASITVVGSIYGAGLKTRQEVQKESERRHEASPAEKIALLQENRGALVAKRIGLEKKIRELEMRGDGATREQSLAGQERRR
ncbi:hypothetical protein B0O99DRAFT_507404 [Bisporella sp. PMI_857]|nr:hypothetical protein B0O99DRAFT_507404 [Bisporella sp. PMI_857]